MTTTSRAAMALLTLTIWSGAGCVWHLDRRAPGTVDLTQPPKRADVPRTETPQDPGEEILRVTTGPWVDIGVMFARPGRSNVTGLVRVGAEVTLARYDTLHSHTEQGKNRIFWPQTSFWQLNLGLSVISAPFDAPESASPWIGPAYLELQRSHDHENMLKSWGWALGYAVDPSSSAHGPQALFRGVGGLYNLRAGYLFGEGAHVTLVMHLPHFPMAWVWSR